MKYFNATKGVALFDIALSNERKDIDEVKMRIYLGNKKQLPVIENMISSYGYGQNMLVRLDKSASFDKVDISEHLSDTLSLYDFEAQYETEFLRELSRTRIKGLEEMEAPAEVILKEKKQLKNIVVQDPNILNSEYFAMKEMNRVGRVPVRVSISSLSNLCQSFFYAIDKEFWLNYDHHYGKKYQYEEGLENAQLCDTIFEEAKIELRLESKTNDILSKIPNGIIFISSKGVNSDSDYLPQCQIFYSSKEELKKIKISTFFNDCKMRHNQPTRNGFDAFLWSEEISLWLKTYKEILHKNFADKLDEGFCRFLPERA